MDTPHVTSGYAPRAIWARCSTTSSSPRCFPTRRPSSMPGHAPRPPASRRATRRRWPPARSICRRATSRARRARCPSWPAPRSHTGRSTRAYMRSRAATRQTRSSGVSGLDLRGRCSATTGRSCAWIRKLVAPNPSATPCRGPRRRRGCELHPRCSAVELAATPAANLARRDSHLVTHSRRARRLFDEPPERRGSALVTFGLANRQIRRKASLPTSLR